MSSIKKFGSVILSLIVIFGYFSINVLAQNGHTSEGTTNVEYEDWKKQASEDPNKLTSDDITKHINDADFQIEYINKINDPVKLQMAVEMMDSDKFSEWAEQADKGQINSVQDWSGVSDENVAQIKDVETLTYGSEPTIKKMGNRISALDQAAFQASIKKLTNTEGSSYSYDVSSSQKSSVQQIGGKWVIAVEGKTLEPSDNFPSDVIGWVAVDDPPHFTAIMRRTDNAIIAQQINDAMKKLEGIQTNTQLTDENKKQMINILEKDVEKIGRYEVSTYADSIKGKDDGTLELSGNQVVVEGQLKNFDVNDKHGNRIVHVVENREGSFEVEGLNIKADNAEAYAPADYFDGKFIRTVVDGKADIETLPLAGRQTTYVDLTDTDKLIGGQTSGRNVMYHKDQLSPGSIFFTGEIPTGLKEKVDEAKKNIPTAQSENGEVWIKREGEKLFVYATGTVQLSSYHREGTAVVEDKHPKFRFDGVGADSKLDYAATKDQTHSYAYGRFIFEDKDAVFDSSKFNDKNPEMISLIRSTDGATEQITVDGPEGEFMTYTKKGQIKKWISEEQSLVSAAAGGEGSYSMKLEKENGQVKYLLDSTSVKKGLGNNEFLAIDKLMSMKLDEQEEYVAIEPNGAIIYQKSDGQGGWKSAVLDQSARFALGSELTVASDNEEKAYNKLTSGDYALSPEEITLLKANDKLNKHLLQSGINPDKLNDQAYVAALKSSDESIKKGVELDTQANDMQKKLMDQGIIKEDGSLKDGLNDDEQKSLNGMRVLRLEAEKQNIDAIRERLKADGKDAGELEFSSKLIEAQINLIDGKAGLNIKTDAKQGEKEGAYYLLSGLKGEQEKQMRYIIGLSYLEAARRAPHAYPDALQLARLNFEKVADLAPQGSDEKKQVQNMIREIDISTLSAIANAVDNSQGEAIKRAEEKLHLNRNAAGSLLTRGIGESLTLIFAGEAMQETAMAQEEQLSEQSRGVILIKQLMKVKKPGAEEYYTLNEIKELSSREIAEILKLDINDQNTEASTKAKKTAARMQSAIGTAFGNPDVQNLMSGGKLGYQFGNYFEKEEDSWSTVASNFILEQTSVVNVLMLYGGGLTATVRDATVASYLGSGIKLASKATGLTPILTKTGAGIVEHTPTFIIKGGKEFTKWMVRERDIPGLWQQTAKGQAIRAENLAVEAQKLFKAGKTEEAGKAYAEAVNLLKKSELLGKDTVFAESYSSEAATELLKQSKIATQAAQAATLAAQAAKAESFWLKDRSTWNGVKGIYQKIKEAGGELRAGLAENSLNNLEKEYAATEIKFTQLGQKVSATKIAETEGQKMGLAMHDKDAIFLTTDEAGNAVKTEGKVEAIFASSDGKLSKIKLSGVEKEIEGDSLNKLFIRTEANAESFDEMLNLKSSLTELQAQIEGAKGAQGAGAVLESEGKAAESLAADASNVQRGAQDVEIRNVEEELKTLQQQKTELESAIKQTIASDINIYTNLA